MELLYQLKFCKVPGIVQKIKKNKIGIMINISCGCGTNMIFNGTNT